MTAEWKAAYPDLEEVLFDQAALERRVAELAREISRDYEGRTVLLLAVLRGGVPFLADLCRQLTLDVRLDFLAVRRAEEGQVRLTKDLDAPLEGRHVLLVEDIVNQGRTLSYLLALLRLRRPADLKVCAMFAREHSRVPLDYVGFQVTDRFVVGYGLDSYQRCRNLPFLATRQPQGSRLPLPG